MVPKMQEKSVTTDGGCIRLCLARFCESASVLGCGNSDLLCVGVAHALVPL